MHLKNQPFFVEREFSGRMSVGDRPGRWPVVAVVYRIDPAHRSFASLFFDYVRDETRCARNHESAIRRGGVHSRIGENRADSAVHIDGLSLPRTTFRRRTLLSYAHHQHPLRVTVRTDVPCAGP